jgi:tRNA A37 N6-isopentenylltransferase MiaA
MLKDPILAKKIGKNQVRLVRALQLLDQKQNLSNKNKQLYDFKIISCNYSERTILNNTINDNVDKMMKAG